MAGAGPDDDLDVGSWTIPAAELEWRFTTSGGPGGQHANRSNTRAELVFDLAASEAFPPDVADRMRRRLDADVVVVTAGDSRSQYRNRMLARARLRERLLDAMKQARPRRPTRPSGASRRRRLETKRSRGETKRLRRRPDAE